MDKPTLSAKTAKKYVYTGPEGAYKFRHGSVGEFTLDQITAEMADTLIKEGFEYLSPVGKEPKPE